MESTIQRLTKDEAKTMKLMLIYEVLNDTIKSIINNEEDN